MVQRVQEDGLAQGAKEGELGVFYLSSLWREWKRLNDVVRLQHKIVLHIDPMGSADPILFGVNGPPFVIARAQPMAGDLCRYTVTSSDPNDEGEEDIVHTAAIPARIVQTSQCSLCAENSFIDRSI